MFFSCLLVCLFLPFLLPFAFVLPLVMLAMGWSLASDEKQLRLAQKLAQARGESTLYIVESGKDRSLRGTALVLNDWGLTGIAPGQPPFQCAWTAIEGAEEYLPGRLRIWSGGRVFFTEPQRFSLIAEVLRDKLGDKVLLDYDPVSTGARLLDRLEKGRHWQDLSMDMTGLQVGSTRVQWDSLDQVVEHKVVHKADIPSYRLTLGKLEVDTAHDGYQLIKATAERRLPGKTSFIRPVPNPGQDEFEALFETTRAAMIVFRQGSKRTHLLQSYFWHMDRLVKRFGLSGREVDQFQTDYDLLKASA